MNREDIIRMAQEAGISQDHAQGMTLFLKDFAALVASAERERINDEAKAHLQELRNNFDAESTELRLHKWTRGQA